MLDKVFTSQPTKTETLWEESVTLVNNKSWNTQAKHNISQNDAFYHNLVHQQDNIPSNSGENLMQLPDKSLEAAQENDHRKGLEQSAGVNNTTRKFAMLSSYQYFEVRKTNPAKPGFCTACFLQSSIPHKQYVVSAGSNNETILIGEEQQNSTCPCCSFVNCDLTCNCDVGNENQVRNFGLISLQGTNSGEVILHINSNRRADADSNEQLNFCCGFCCPSDCDFYGCKDDGFIEISSNAVISSSLIPKKFLVPIGLYAKFKLQCNWNTNEIFNVEMQRNPFTGFDFIVKAAADNTIIAEIKCKKHVTTLEVIPGTNESIKAFFISFIIARMAAMLGNQSNYWK